MFNRCIIEQFSIVYRIIYLSNFAITSATDGGLSPEKYPPPRTPIARLRELFRSDPRYPCIKYSIEYLAGSYARPKTITQRPS